MLKIGLTGGIGAGKSVVSKILTSLNYPVFNSDTEAKLLLIEDDSAIVEMKEAFGDEVYHSDGSLNRTHVAEIIFNDSKKREAINAIVHPRVRKRFEALVERSESPLVFNEAAILFETDSYKKFDKNVLVAAPDELRIERVMKRDKVSREAVQDRMNAQWTDDQKKQLADFVIINDERIPLIPQVEELVSSLNQLL